jgi:two-component system invasion response regulator UvrY
MRILITDDHPVVRAGVIHILKKNFPDVVIGEASNGRQLFEQLRQHRWDLVLLDITMPGRSGLDLLAQIKEGRSRLPVIVLTIHAENEYAIRALRAGAAGYVTKDAIPEMLVTAVQKALKGGTYVSDTLAERLATRLTLKNDMPVHEALTNREYEVLRLLSSGLSVGEIAHKLNLSAKTISTFRARLLQKTGLKNNAAIIRYCIQHHLSEENV